jgi:N-acetylmuramoyl-L-alanine amidase
MIRGDRCKVARMRNLPLLVALALPLAGCAESAAAPSRADGSAVTIHNALIEKGRFGRSKVRVMQPRFITIHTTQNFAPSADARAHARMLQSGSLKGPKNSLGFVTWHFTVDQDSVWQSLPTNEQGQHADYEGPGNRSSIGIEMCENRGNSRAMTTDRTARLTAELMQRHNIPLGNVVPHQHWPMVRFADGRHLGQKNCPHFLMDNGRPGKKWNAFIDQVARYRKQL